MKLDIIKNELKEHIGDFVQNEALTAVTEIVRIKEPEAPPVPLPDIVADFGGQCASKVLEAVFTTSGVKG